MVLLQVEGLRLIWLLLKIWAQCCLTGSHHHETSSLEPVTSSAHKNPETPWICIMCVGSLTTKKVQLSSENLLFSIFLPKTDRCISGKLLWWSLFDVALCTWAEVRLRCTDRALKLEIWGGGCGWWRWEVLRLWFEGNHEMLWLWNKLVRNASGEDMSAF